MPTKKQEIFTQSEKKKLIRISISSQAYCSDMALISHLFIDFDDSMTM
jgi:hypothetical protein